MIEEKMELASLGANGIVQLGPKRGKEEEEEYQEQLAAQIAALSCEIPMDSIMQGITNSVLYFRQNRKTKAEWNAERVRDVRVCKVSSKKKKEEVLDNFELHGTAKFSAFGVETDPVPYIRNYKSNSYQQLLLEMNQKHVSFGSIRIIDLCGQLIGDSKLGDVCYQMRRCPVVTLNLSTNNITDTGMEHLSTVLRSLPQIRDLILSGNHISDSGVEAIFRPNTYAPTLRKLDLSCNTLGTRTAFAIGRMFRKDMVCRLDELYLGGRVGKKGWGDEFVRILVDLLCKQGARPIRVLSIPAAVLTSDGIAAIAALIVCSPELRTLNLTKNTLQEPQSRLFLRDALRVSQSLNELYIGQSGIPRKERDLLEYSCKSRYSLTWNEKIQLGYLTARELNICSFMGHAIEVVILNNWQSTKPLHFPEISGTYPTKEELGSESTEHIPLVYLTSNMRLDKSMVSTLHNCDEISSQVKTLHESYFACSKWLKDNVEHMRMTSDMKVTTKRMKFRMETMNTRRENLLVLLEKFTSISIVKTRMDADGELRKVKNKKKKKEKGEGWKNSGSKKNSKINIDTVSMTIEELYTSLIELTDTLQYLIGITYMIKLRYQEIQSKMLEGKNSAVLSRRGAITKPHAVSNASSGVLPYSISLGTAALYTHFMHLNGPLEAERIRKSAVAFERDIRRQEDIATKKAIKFKSSGKKKVGQRLRVFRPDELEERNKWMLEHNLQQENEEEKVEVEEESVVDVNNHYVSESEEESSSDEDTSSEEEDDENENDKQKDENVREPTKFLVPKRDMQKKYESLYVEDLIADKVAIKNAISVLARSNRRHMVRSLACRLVLPPNNPQVSQNDVTVDVQVETEEERPDSLSALSRLNTIRPRSRLQDRLRQRRVKHKYEREEAESM